MVGGRTNISDMTRDYLTCMGSSSESSSPTYHIARNSSDLKLPRLEGEGRRGSGSMEIGGKNPGIRRNAMSYAGSGGDSSSWSSSSDSALPLIKGTAADSPKGGAAAGRTKSRVLSLLSHTAAD